MGNTTENRMDLIKKVNTKFDEVIAQDNIDKAIDLGVASNVLGMENTNGQKFTTTQFEDSINKNLLKVKENGEPEFTTSQIIEQGIKNNVKVPAYKNALVAGAANMSDIGNKEKVVTGLELYKKFCFTLSIASAFTISEVPKSSLYFSSKIIA